MQLSEYNSIFVTATLNPINLKTINFRPPRIPLERTAQSLQIKSSGVFSFEIEKRVIFFCISCGINFRSVGFKNLFFLHQHQDILWLEKNQMDLCCKPVAIVHADAIMGMQHF